MKLCIRVCYNTLDNVLDKLDDCGFSWAGLDGPTSEELRCITYLFVNTGLLHITFTTASIYPTTLEKMGACEVELGQLLTLIEHNEKPMDTDPNNLQGLLR